MSDLNWLTAAEAARAIAARELSPVELMETLLKRIDHWVVLGRCDDEGVVAAYRAGGGASRR